MNEPSGHFILLEPESPEALIPDAWLEPWMVALGLVFLAAVAAFALFLKRKKSSAADPSALRREAHAAAASALDEMTPPHAREAAVQSSLILRKYLATAASDPALFETHEETLSRHEAFKGFSQEAQMAATRGFSWLATLKYAADLPDVETAAVIRGSRELLETLHHGFEA